SPLDNRSPPQPVWKLHYASPEEDHLLVEGDHPRVPDPSTEKHNCARPRSEILTGHIWRENQKVSLRGLSIKKRILIPGVPGISTRCRLLNEHNTRGMELYLP
ncbi:hypothetical protein KQX54_003472, partial [Cotesia glomerata]